MLYISKDYKDGTYGIADTDNNSEARYVLSDIINVMKLKKLQVKGVSLKHEKVTQVFKSREDLINDFISKAKLLRSLNIRHNSETGDYILRGRVKQGTTSFEVPYGVTVIADEFFADCETLESVVLPDTVNRLGKFCFRSCTSLKSVNIPNGISVIPYCCFADCQSLRSIDLPDSLECIKYGAFAECTNLTGIVLPDGVTQLKTECFSKCTSLRYVKLPMHIESLGYACFKNCSELETVDMRCELKTIDDDVFRGCFKLRDINLPDTIESIGYCCFRGCALSHVSLPKSLIDLGDECFSDIASLTSVEFATGTNVSKFRMGKNCFTDCQNLKSIKIPKDVFEANGNDTRLGSLESIIEFI